MRLLRVRAGHSAPPRCVRFERSAGRGADSSQTSGSGGPDVSVLSAGEDSTVRSFSLAHESRDRSFGRASFDKAASRRAGLKRDRHCMPPIVTFALGTHSYIRMQLVYIHDFVREHITRMFRVVVTRKFVQKMRAPPIGPDWWRSTTSSSRRLAGIWSAARWARSVSSTRASVAFHCSSFMREQLYALQQYTAVDVLSY